MHWLDGLYRLVYSTAMREITRSISYSEMERLGIERIIMWGLWLHPNIYFPTKHPTFLTSLTSSSSDRPLATFAQTPEVRQQHKQQFLNSAAAAEQQAMLLSPLTQSDSHFCPLALIEPFCWHQTKVYLGRVKFADFLTFCQKEQSTNNSQFWRNINPSLPNVSRPLTPMTVRVARARARRSQLVKQIGTQPARDCQTES